MKTQTAWVIVASALSVLAVAACGQDDAPLPQSSETVAPGPSPIPTSVAPTPTTEIALPVPTLAAPTPTTGIFGGPHAPPTARVSPSLEEQILESDAIVRASFKSAIAGTETVPSDPGVAPTYRAAHLLRFTVHEYLKGSGPSQIVVVVREGHTYVAKADALERAEAKLLERNTTWDDREAVLFLMTYGWLYPAGTSIDSPGNAAASTKFEFALSNPVVQTDWEYSIDTLSRAWLPARYGRAAAGASASTVRTFITDGSASPSPTVSFADLRSRIAQMEATLEAGAGIEGFLRCIRGKYGHERHRRARPWTPRHLQTTLVSAEIEGTEVDRDDYTGVPKYHRYRLTGPDADLFRTLVSDADAYPANGFDNIIVTARPLHAGVYRLQNHWQFYSDIPCNFIPDDVYDEWTITVTAPAGTLHEAFFDPVAIGNAVGADGTNGVLKPAAFTVGGASATISSLKWESGTATMVLSPSASLAGHAVDFIALDGSVTSTLAFDDATQSGGTLTWSAATQPWNAGDKLMLRIRPAATTITPPTATPTPEATPTPPSTPVLVMP